jgi:hypothetical protein
MIVNKNKRDRCFKGISLLIFAVNIKIILHLPKLLRGALAKKLRLRLYPMNLIQIMLA